MLSLMQF